MQPNDIKTLEGWVSFLSQAEIPVLKQTQRDLNKLLENIENAGGSLLMLGVEVFFNKLPAKPLVEEMLLGHTAALISILQVVHRSHRASYYALDWAIRMRDMHFEEVRIAALLHDLAELLVWCFAPAKHAENQCDAATG